jgi:molecular chaperone GrpE
MNGEFDDVREEDIEVIPPDGEEQETASASSAAEVKRLTDALEQKTRDLTDANEKYLRAAADFENSRKRMQRDLVDFRKYANEQMALELLSVIDHLGFALKHGQEATGEASPGLQQGVELVYKQLRDTLEKFGVKSFVAEGEPFDPAKHEAMLQVVTADAPENTVVQVLQEGYLYHEKVLRHAKVGVAKKPDEAKQEEEVRQETENDAPMNE